MFRHEFFKIIGKLKFWIMALMIGLTKFAAVFTLDGNEFNLIFIEKCITKCIMTLELGNTWLSDITFCIMCFVAYAVSDENMKKLLSLGCVGYLVIQLLFSQFIVANRFVSNTLDEVYVNMAYQKILEYEKETGKTLDSWELKELLENDKIALSRFANAIIDAKEKLNHISKIIGE